MPRGDMVGGLAGQQTQCGAQIGDFGDEAGDGGGPPFVLFPPYTVQQKTCVHVREVWRCHRCDGGADQS